MLLPTIIILTSFIPKPRQLGYLSPHTLMIRRGVTPFPLVVGILVRLVGLEPTRPKAQGLNLVSIPDFSTGALLVLRERLELSMLDLVRIHGPPGRVQSENWRCGSLTPLSLGRKHRNSLEPFVRTMATNPL